MCLDSDIYFVTLCLIAGKHTLKSKCILLKTFKHIYFTGAFQLTGPGAKTKALFFGRKCECKKKTYEYENQACLQHAQLKLVPN